MESKVAITMQLSAYEFLINRAKNQNERVFSLLTGAKETVKDGNYVTVIWEGIDWNEGWNRDVDALILWLRPFKYRKQIIGEDLDDISFEDNVPFTDTDNEDYEDMEVLIKAAPYISREFVFDNN